MSSSATASASASAAASILKSASAIAGALSSATIPVPVPVPAPAPALLLQTQKPHPPITHRDSDVSSIEKHSEAGSTPFALYFNGKTNIPPRPQMSINALSTVVDNLSEEEAVCRLDTVNANIAQVASSLAIKASSTRGKAGHTRPQMLPRIGRDDYKISERSLHFEEMATALIANVMQTRICSASSALGISDEMSRFLTKMEADIGRKSDFTTANQWRSVLYKAKDDTGFKSTMHECREELHRELCHLLLWCGMEADQQSAHRVASSARDLLSSATAQLQRLYVDIQTQVVSLRLLIGLSDDMTKLIIASITENGLKKSTR